MPLKIILEYDHPSESLSIKEDSVPNPKHPFQSFMSDDNGNFSSMRLMSFISLIAALIISGFLLFLDRLTPQSVTLVSLFIFGAFAPKALQKFAETK